MKRFSLSVGLATFLSLISMMCVASSKTFSLTCTAENTSNETIKRFYIIVPHLTETSKLNEKLINPGEEVELNPGINTLEISGIKLKSDHHVGFSPYDPSLEKSGSGTIIIDPSLFNNTNHVANKEKEPLVKFVDCTRKY